MNGNRAGETIDDIAVEACGTGRNELIDSLRRKAVRRSAAIISAYGGEMRNIPVESGECFAC
jgi:hypothetical protein